MPVLLQLPIHTDPEVIEVIFGRLVEIDNTYSTYIESSEVSMIRAGKKALSEASEELRSILELGKQAKTQSNGYFDMFHKGVFDPSGIVKGWAISQSTSIMQSASITDFIVEIAGDMVCSGFSSDNQKWSVGIRDPRDATKIVKALSLSDVSIATSGTSERGQHIYNPIHDMVLDELSSISVIGPDIIQADVYATAAFAMGRAGIEWLETVQGYEGFAIMPDMTGISTSRFAAYTL
jgi:thiamine biosynthesis lipoprotein